MLKSHITLISIIFIFVLIISGCSQQNQTAQIPQSQGVDSLVIVLNGIEGQSALDLLKNGHHVVEVNTTSGSFVKAVDSFENSSTAFWLYSVNDSLLAFAADKYITTDSDIVRWHFRKAD